MPIDWDELDGIRGANIYAIGDARKLLDRASGKALKGWGFAAQMLPDL